MPELNDRQVDRITASLKGELLRLKPDYSRSKDVGLFRPMTLEEIKASSGQTVYVTSARTDDCFVMLKVTSVKVWKTRPDEVLVGVKYGMYDTGKWDERMALRRMLVRLD